MEQTQIDISDYDQSGYDYREYWHNRQYDNLIEQQALEKLLPSFDERLIDIGGGFGRLMDTYQSHFKHITILDYSQNNLKNAQSRIEAQQLQNIVTKHGDVYDLPFGDNTFNYALLVRVLHHLERPSLAFHEIQRTLKPGGKLIMQYSSKLHIKNRIKSMLTRNPALVDKKPVNLSEKGIFYQYHPDFVAEKLKENDLVIMEQFSTAHLRIPLLYKTFPATLLASIERILVKVFGKLYLGPSIFVIAEKR